MSIRAALTADPLTYARYGFSNRDRSFWVQVISLSIQGEDKVHLWETSILCARKVAELLAPYCTLSAADIRALDHDRCGEPLIHQMGV